MAKGPKPDKPYPGFPLYAHPVGQWAKKIRGETHYFGVWADPDAALERYLDERDELHAGRRPREIDPGLTVGELASRFLTAKRQQVDAGEIGLRIWSSYHAMCAELVASLGAELAVAHLRPEDFALARADAAARLGPVSLGAWIQRVRTLFKWGYEAEFLDKPVRFGPGFKKPARRIVRLQRAAAGRKLVSAEDARKLIDAADVQLRAMVLLGLNCGFGNSDCSDLPIAALDLARRWIDFPRPKTGIGRRCPLWPETARALAAAIAERPAAKNEADKGCVFLTRLGQRWVRYRDRGIEKRGTATDAVSMMFRRLVKEVGVSVPGGFYTLRHTFRTVADAARDRVAIDLIMGHVDESMGGRYRESVADERLRAVAEHVRAWLWPRRKSS